MMAFMIDPSVILSFQNTGEEHEKTLEFLCRMEDDLQRPIHRLEWRAPPRGEPPRNATFEEVSHACLARHGEPFRDVLACLAAFRAKAKGKGPIAPWPRQRLCTAYLKIKTQRAYMRSLGFAEWTAYVGLRADEPQRVHDLLRRNEREISHEVPLYEQNITKADVMRFWSQKPYDLDLPEHLGNCKACFMKDERDLATALLDPATDPSFYLGIERDFGPMRRKRSSYAQVLEEAPQRMKIRQALAEGAEPPQGALPATRFKLIVAQEKVPAAAWSCACEGAELLANDVDKSDDLILELEAATQYEHSFASLRRRL